jgi:outer membrane biosynthesis protein TonB
MAGTVNLKGNVKVEVVVGPSGAVKSVAIKGGHPVFAKSAENAVFKWSGSRRQGKPGSWSR